MLEIYENSNIKSIYILTIHSQTKWNIKDDWVDETLNTKLSNTLNKYFDVGVKA